jgi:hypothetical protein
MPNNVKFSFARLSLTTAVAVVIIALLATCGGDDPNGPDRQLPMISSFTAQPASILITDTTVLSWQVSYADSVGISPPGQMFTPGDSGTLAVAPTASTRYWVFAYNQYGMDTASTIVTVRVVPFRVRATQGNYYRGTMGSAELNKPLTFLVTDSAGSPQSGKKLHFSLLDGDGTLSADSGVTDGSGEFALSHTFDGSLGTATIRVAFRDFDSTEVYLRSDLLTFGNGGQGGWVLLDDRFQDVKNFLGEPDRIDDLSAEEFIFTFAIYEENLGVVVALYDTTKTGMAYDTTSVYAVFVEDSIVDLGGGVMSARYEGTTANGLGVGSYYWRDIVPEMGEADLVEYDDTDPELLAWQITYNLNDSSRVLFWGHVSDTLVFQVDINEELGTPTPAPAGYDIQRAISEYRKLRHR